MPGAKILYHHPSGEASHAREGGREGKTTTSSKMDHHVVMNTSLKELRDQVREQSLWRKSVYVVSIYVIDLMVHNQSIKKEL